MGRSRDEEQEGAGSRRSVRSQEIRVDLLPSGEQAISRARGRRSIEEIRRKSRSAERRLERLAAAVGMEFGSERERERFHVYRRNPEGFAREVLGSRWWSRQREVAQCLVKHQRVVVRSANGVGKTYLAADLALWFLYSYSPSIVLTTAPTKRQVDNLLWEEIRKRRAGARSNLRGSEDRTQIRVNAGWYALGLSALRADSFQGFHKQNLLIIFDEASGIADEIWEAAEGIAVGGNNRILAIGNPLRAAGRFYQLFQKEGRWKRLAISALEHPNLTGREKRIEGAVSEQAIEDRVVEWCEPIGEGVQAFRCSGVQEGTKGTEGTERTGCRADGFEWRGRRYSVNNLFRARVLGEFPDSDDEALIPIGWIEAAMARGPASPPAGLKRMAVDVARFGSDSTVIGMRVGAVVKLVDAIRGQDTMAIANRLEALAYAEHPASIAVDEIGVGAGVVDRLRELGVDGVVAVNVAQSAYDSERFENRRAELYWGLRERFRSGEIALERDEAMLGELMGVRYKITAGGKIAMEKKEDMKRRGAGSPDRADMLAMLFDSSCEWVDASGV